MKQYRRKGYIVAVQMNLDLQAPVTYDKWDDIQTAKVGDWLVNADGENYTIDQESFANTYEATAVPGHYVKTAVIQAEVATEGGIVVTKEGSTSYVAGDYLVSNNPDDPTDVYAIGAEKFASLYQEV